MSEKWDTRGMSQRELLVEVRDDLKKLVSANLIERIETVEENQRWFNRALAAQFLTLLGGVVVAVIR